MRVLPSGFGNHPSGENAIHLWSFAQAASTDNLLDLIEDGETLSQWGSPTVDQAAPIETGRLFDGSSDYCYGAGTGTDAAALNGTPFTVVWWAKTASDYATTGVVVSYEAAGESLGTNALIRTGVDSTMHPFVFWEYGAGTDVLTTATLTLLPGHWYCVVWVFDGTDLYLYVNGVLQETTTPAHAPEADSSGNTQIWRVGVNSAGQYFDGTICSVAVYTDALSDEFVRETFRRGMLWRANTQVHVKVAIETQDSTTSDPTTFQDLSSFRSRDWLVGCHVQNDVDARGPYGTVELLREMGDASLSKFHDNRNNRAPLTATGPDGSTYDTDSEFLALGRRIQISVSRQPFLSSRLTSADTRWNVVLDGVITGIDWAGTTVKIDVLDRRVQMLQRGFLEEIEVWSNADGTPLSDKDADEWRDDPSTDTGEDLETVLQGILTHANSQDWVGDDPDTAGAVSLYVPTSPAYSKLKFENAKQPILDCLTERADKIGWVVWSVFDPVTNKFRLTLHEPNRTQAVQTCTLDSLDYRDVTELSINDSKIRNVVLVAWHSREDATPTPTNAAPSGFTRSQTGEAPQGDLPSRHTLQYVNTASVARYGRSWMCCSDVSQIDTVDEAEAFALALCRDLCEPTADQTVTAEPFPELEVNDLIEWVANNRHYTTDQRLAAVSLEHQYGADNTTSVRCRGTPCGSPLRSLAYDPRVNCGIAPSRPGESYHAEFGPSRRRTGNSDLLAGTYVVRAPNNASIPNGDFEDYVFGMSGPPYGWRMVAGVWGTDVDIYADATTGLKGLRLIYPDVNDDFKVQLRSRRVRVVPNKPYRFYWRWKRLEVNGYDRGGVVLRILDQDKTLITGDTQRFVNDPGSDWYCGQVHVLMPEDARYAEIDVYKDEYGGYTNFVVDLVNIEQVTFGCTAYASNTQVLSNISGNTYGDTLNLNSTLRDAGDIHDAGTYTVTIPEDGKYRLKAEAVVKPTVANSTITGMVELQKSGATWVRGPGLTSTALYDGVRLIVDSGTVTLTAGDAITVYATVVDSSGSSPTVQSNFVNTVLTVEQVL